MAIPTFSSASGCRIPSIGLGTWQLTGSSLSQAIHSAYHAGYTHIDTAEFYGNEDVIGSSIVDLPRDSLFITSKVWPDNYSSKDGLRRALSQSLERLNTSYLDLYLLHWPRKGTDYREVFSELKSLVNDGLIKHVGVSNFTVNHLKEILPILNDIGLDIAVNQVEFHPGLYQRELLEFCKDNGILLTAYSPFAHGQLSYTELESIASSLGVSSFQVALRWLYQHGVVSIPKSADKLHIRANADIFDFSLSEKQMSSIDNLGDSNRVIDPPFAEFDY